jgi:tRNA nucleotidyltransferase (CCA-adding enzyme)
MVHSLARVSFAPANFLKTASTTFFSTSKQSKYLLCVQQRSGQFLFVVADTIGYSSGGC